ncbi:hypothetical protein DFH09DRAFT_1287310 [Mycena vulgaris]|nr:hypothetical protein DFH09DRAFT_1287310 [Mycena vulgaris]
MVAFSPFVILLLALPAFPVAGQVAHTSWRKPNVTTSITDRVTLAEAALEKAIGMLNSTTGLFDGVGPGGAAFLYGEMAEFDLFTNQTKYGTTLQQYFPLAGAGRTNFSDSAAYGRAAAKAYAAYKNPTFRDYAVQSWYFGRSYTISQSDVTAGTITTKDFPIQKVCQGVTMAGGTFWITDRANPGMVGLGTGSFLVLSALLAEATSDPMYLQAAWESVDFIHAHLYNVQNVVQDGISASANDACSSETLQEPYNSGLMIEGLAILSSIANNATVQTLLSDILTATIPNTAWQKDNGIVGDMNMVQGLAAVYTRNATTPALRAYVEAYLSVQFNAVIDLATSDGTNIYAGNWNGPPSATFLAGNQTSALSALLTAITLRNETASPTPPGPLPAPPTPTPSPRRKLGPILGGILGAVALLVAGIVMWFILRRRSRATHPLQIPPSQTANRDLDPFPPNTSEVDAFRTESRSQRFNNSLPGVRYRENSGKHPDYPLSQSLSSTEWAMHSAGMNGGGSGASDAEMPEREALNPSQPHPSALPTEELVRLLNDRLQNREWDEEEAPPEYPTS